MNMKQILKSLTVVLAVMVFSCSSTYADIIPISSAISFQDEGTTTTDNTMLLSVLDDDWAPSISGTITKDYYATGTSPEYWDAVSLNFDLSPIGWDNIASAELAFYTKQGGHGHRPDWHHYEVLQGAFNPTHEDLPPPMGVDFGGHGNYGLVGWLTQPIPLSWITGGASNSFDITLRLWNAQIDTVQIWAEPVPVPGAFLLGSIGLAFASWKLRKRREL